MQYIFKNIRDWISPVFNTVTQTNQPKIDEYHSTPLSSNTVNVNNCFANNQNSLQGHWNNAQMIPSTYYHGPIQNCTYHNVNGVIDNSGVVFALETECKIRPYHQKIAIFGILEDHDDTSYTISREDLLKYIRVLKLIDSGNELIKVLWDRVQVAEKLIGSSENESEEP